MEGNLGHPGAEGERVSERGRRGGEEEWKGSESEGKGGGREGRGKRTHEVNSAPGFFPPDTRVVHHKMESHHFQSSWVSSSETLVWLRLREGESIL